MSDDLASLPSLNALRAFEVSARHLNFRLAADELGVTQAAVAQQIRNLEASLGMKLFARLPRGLALTESGRSYSASIRRALELIVEATLALRPDSLHLTVSVPPSFASRWLIPRIALFTEAYPDIDLRVLATERLSRFHTDGVDVAVRYGNPPFGPGLNTELLVAQSIIVVGSPALLDKLGRPADLAHLQRYLWLHDAHNLWPQFIAHVFAQPLQGAAKNLRFNSTSLAVDAALAGQGLALVTRAFIQDDLDAGRLVQVLEQSLPMDAGFYLVWPRNAREPGPLLTVLAWLREQARSISR